MAVCRGKGRPALALVALETLLKLVEMTLQTEALNHAVMMSSDTTPVLWRTVVTGRLVDRAVLTREFVKVRSSD